MTEGHRGALEQEEIRGDNGGGRHGGWGTKRYLSKVVL